MTNGVINETSNTHITANVKYRRTNEFGSITNSITVH
jgi:hypothetical protein